MGVISQWQQLLIFVLILSGGPRHLSFLFFKCNLLPRVELECVREGAENTANNEGSAGPLFSPQYLFAEAVAIKGRLKTEKIPFSCIRGTSETRCNKAKLFFYPQPYILLLQHRSSSRLPIGLDRWASSSRSIFRSSFGQKKNQFFLCGI